jgi:hypothetical protein
MSIILPCIQIFFYNTYVFRIFMLVFFFGLIFSIIGLTSGKGRSL